MRTYGSIRTDFGTLENYLLAAIKLVFVQSTQPCLKPIILGSECDYIFFMVLSLIMLFVGVLITHKQVINIETINLLTFIKILRYYIRNLANLFRDNYFIVTWIFLYNLLLESIEYICDLNILIDQPLLFIFSKLLIKLFATYWIMDRLFKVNDS